MHQVIGVGLAFALVVLLGALFLVLALSSVILVAPEALRMRILSRRARCPTCASEALKLVVIIPFGDRFYRCSHCGARCKRRPFAWTWESAWGPEDDARYRKREVRTWVAGATAGVSDTTCGKLLMSKTSWVLRALVHRTGGNPLDVRPDPPEQAKSLENSETTVGRLLRKKIFRGSTCHQKPPPDPWLEF